LTGHPSRFATAAPGQARRVGKVSLVPVHAMNQGRRWKSKPRSEQGRAEMEKLPLAPWASQGRRELLELLDRMNATIEELTGAAEQEATVPTATVRSLSHD
jgi:hypothetical protein